MTVPIVLLASAEADLADARDWYRRTSPDLEHEFAACVHATMERINHHPTAYEAEGPFRRAFVHRFPYRIVYRPTPTHIAVVAILHTGRDPRVWQDRDH